MKNMYFINKSNKLTNNIKFSVFEYNKMIHGLSSEIDRLEESNNYYRKGFIELHDRIEEAIEFIENTRYPSSMTLEEMCDLEDILKGVDKE